MSTSELKDIAAGLYYVARQSKNQHLATDALTKLRALRQNASEMQKTKLTKRIDGYIADCEHEDGPMHAYEITDRIEVHYNPSGICIIGVAYTIALLALATYINAINRSIFGQP